MLNVMQGWRRKFCWRQQCRDGTKEGMYRWWGGGCLISWTRSLVTQPCAQELSHRSGKSLYLHLVTDWSGVVSGIFQFWGGPDCRIQEFWDWVEKTQWIYETRKLIGLSCKDCVLEQYSDDIGLLVLAMSSYVLMKISSLVGELGGYWLTPPYKMISRHCQNWT